MKYINLSSFKEFNDFWILEHEDIVIGFSNANNNRSFNRNIEEGIKNLKCLKEEFNVETVNYLKQVHSNKVFIYNNDNKDFNKNEGDGIVTSKKNSIIGVFTADCTPVILIDIKEKIVAVVHSGWKGTYTSIVKEAVDIMRRDFKCEAKNIKAFIGPHIRQCCYEVSEELKDKFINKFNNIDKDILFKGRNLSMELCIEQDLLQCDISDENILSLSLCTHCEDKEKLFSYRGSNGDYGRLFSLAFIK